MGKSSGKRSGSYTNPRSREQHYKKQNRKFEDMKYQESKKQKDETVITSKKVSSKKKPYKVITNSMYGKVCKPSKKDNIKPLPRSKKDSAKIFLATDEFKTLCIEIPVCMKLFHRLSKQSKQLIVNFINANNWVIPLLEQKVVVSKYSLLTLEMTKFVSGGSARIEFTTKSPFIKELFKSLLRHNFSKRKYYQNYKHWYQPRDVFFYKREEKDFKGKKIHWYFCMNIADLYDCKAAEDKQTSHSIPYSLTINHLIYTGIKNDVESEYSYPVNSRLAILSTIRYAKYPISSYHKVKYVMYINNKHKFDRIKKEEEYLPENFNKVVIKEIPISTKK